MDNMKLLRYARAAAVDKWWCYDEIATQYAGHRAESLARKLADEAKADVNVITEMIHAEEAKRRLAAEKLYTENKNQKLPDEVVVELKNLAKEIADKVLAEQKQSLRAPQTRAPQTRAPQTAGAQSYEQAIKEAPYVLVVKWSNPILGEREYPCKSYGRQCHLQRR